MKKALYFFGAALLCACLLAGCGGSGAPAQEHEKLTIMTLRMDYAPFEAALKQAYPEIRLEFISYTGSNATGYSQYLLEHDEVPDIFTTSVFSMAQKQRQNLIDLAGYEFVNNYMVAQVNQAALDGAVYLLPANLGVIGLYYNQTLFAQRGWKAPENFEELKTLTETIRESGLDPVAAQFELPGNGFFDLFTMAKTDFLATPDGAQWEKAFQAGTARAAQGLLAAVEQLSQLIDCGFLDAEDTRRASAETKERFFSRQAAMYLNAGPISRFTQNEDGTGDQYGILPFYGKDGGAILITLPMRYFGLSKRLQEPGNEQKLADALKVMEFLATPQGQASLATTTASNESYISSLKEGALGEDSPLLAVRELIRGGRVSTLAYAGYEQVIADTGAAVRSWVAGDCTGDDVLALLDRLQAEALGGALPPAAVAAQDFTLEETAQLQAEAFRQATGADVGLVSLGGYLDGVENPSGVCGKFFAGEISPEVVTAVVPYRNNDPLCVLTMSGAELKALLEIGFCPGDGAVGFPYVPSGIVAARGKEGGIDKITLADGAPLDEAARYTVAVDLGGFTGEIGERYGAVTTEHLVEEAVRAYLGAHSPLSPLAPSWT